MSEPTPRVTRGRWPALALLMAVGLVIALVSRERSEDAAPSEATVREPHASSAQTSAEPAAKTSPELAAEAPRRDASTAEVLAHETQAAPARDAGSEPAAAAQENPVARLMRTSDAHDRKLLSSIERATGLAPSARVHELLALARSGQSEAELRRFIDTSFTDDVRVRLLAARWLRERAAPSASATDSAADAKDAANTGASPLGQGGGRKHVQRPQPVQPRDPR